MKPSRKRSASAAVAQKQNKKGKKAKVETGVGDDDASKPAAAPMTTCTILFSTAQQESDAVKQIGRVFGKTKAESQAIVNLAKTLRPDDPAIHISFRSGEEIRNSLQSTSPAFPNAAANRPCAPGNNGDEALQNLKNWVRGQLSPTNAMNAVDTREQGLGIGNLTQAEYNALTLTLSFNQPPADQWGGANVAKDRSLGRVIGITGEGVGSATITVLASIGFRG